MADTTDIAIIGAGNIGIAVAYYLVAHHGLTRIVLLEPGDPMAMTSAQSGENYRNWWPHPVMTAFTLNPAVGLSRFGRFWREDNRGWLIKPGSAEVAGPVAGL